MEKTENFSARAYAPSSFQIARVRKLRKVNTSVERTETEVRRAPVGGTNPSWSASNGPKTS